MFGIVSDQDKVNISDIAELSFYCIDFMPAKGLDWTELSLGVVGKTVCESRSKDISLL